MLSLNLELVKVGGYDFLTHVMAPGTVIVFSKLPLVETEFDMPTLG
jgi:hypothetical protein